MHLANSFFHFSFGLLSQCNGGKHIHVSFWTSVSLTADTAIINTMWQISVDIVWKKKKPSNCLLVCFPCLPSCDFSLPCCGSRWCFVHGSLQICWEEAKVSWSRRCKGWCGGDEMWRWDWPLGSILPASHTGCPGSQPSLVLISSGKLEITEQQRQNQQGKNTKSPHSGAEVLTGTGRRLRCVNGKNTGRVHVFRYFFTYK